uniref:Putative cytochrome c oxidase subunit viic n=1 Tax=Triatoma dimidiata TaxID=72491 RepID=A0A0V0G505_TRIDM
MIVPRFANFARQISTSASRQGLHGGHLGENLPFKLGSPIKTTLVFILYFGVPFAGPFIVVRHQMLKK